MRISAKRFWRTRGALIHLCNKRQASGQMLEIVIGHATFAGLLRREVLSVFHTVYKFMREHYLTPAPLWPSVREELKTFAGLMVFLVSSWVMPWNSVVSCSDACEEGYGVCTRWLPPDLVARVGRTRERDRYRSAGHVRARDAVLGAQVEDPEEEPAPEVLDGLPHGDWGKGEGVRRGAGGDPGPVGLAHRWWVAFQACRGHPPPGGAGPRTVFRPHCDVRAGAEHETAPAQ